MVSDLGLHTEKNNVLKDKQDTNIDKAVKLSFGLICDKTNKTRCVPIQYADQTVHLTISCPEDVLVNGYIVS